SRHPSITPFGVFRAADGYLVIAAGNNSLFRKLCEVLGVPALAADPRFSSNDARTEHHAELRTDLERALITRSVADWLAVLEANDLPCSPINDVADVVDHPQVRARNMIVQVDDPVIGPFICAGNPVKIGGFDDPDSRSPAPSLNADAVRL